MTIRQKSLQDQVTVKTELKVWQKRVENLLVYFLCDYCKEDQIVKRNNEMFKEEKNELETKRKAWKHKLIGILDCSLCPQCVEDKDRVFNREEGLS